MIAALIPEDQVWTLWALIVAGTAFSIWLEGRYRWAEKLSAPVVALLIAMLLSNTGIMPAKEIPAYDFIGAWLVPLALPLLLMQADMVKIAREAGRLMLAVLFASAGTIVGAFAAVAFLKDQGIPQIEHAAAIMTGSYIGGMVNFLAIENSTGATEELTSGLVVADNLVMAGFFLILLWMAGSKFFLKHYPHPHSTADGHALEEEAEAPVLLTVNGLGAALAFAFVVVALAMGTSKLIAGLFPEGLAMGSALGLLKTIATNKYVMITSFSLLAATLAPRALVRLRGYERIGIFLLFLYLFSIGLPADLRTVISKTPALFGFCLIMAVGNVVFTMLLGKLFRLDLEELLLAINATLGGPPTAAAMAVSRGWKPLVLPGLLAGLWGYVIGTPLGLMVFAMMTG
ncbi:DUF819 domain-containing protein [Luteolibacter sp. Populi]|uniref:DUF819 family protein n=1 Tax=Luteolibacter sp. Populi TaxID=3230487 RepID=UPI0034662D09